MARVLPIAAVPTLDEVAANPERARDLPAEVARALTWKCLTALTALQVGNASGTGTQMGFPTRASDGERLLTVHDVAERIGMSTSWVEKHTGDLPARVSVAGNPRWRKSDLEGWIKNRPEYGRGAIDT